jgi:hypothetical protein
MSEVSCKLVSGTVLSSFLYTTVHLRAINQSFLKKKQFMMILMMEINPLIPPTVPKTYGNKLQAHRMVLFSPKPIEETTD